MSYKYIHMTLIGSLPKTKIYSINTIGDNTRIGIIKWYGPWRQYCFLPEPDTVFSKGCSEHINNFIQKLMDERKKKGR